MKKKLEGKPSSSPQERRIQAIRMLSDAGMADQALALAGASTTAATPVFPKAQTPLMPQADPKAKPAAMAGSDVKKPKPVKDRKAIAAEQLGLSQIKRTTNPSIIIVRDPNCIPCDEQNTKGSTQ